MGTENAELAYVLNGETRYYNSVWEKIQDEHFPECPISVSASQQRKSTCCMCDVIETANKSAEECLRCHRLAEACARGVKAQMI